MTVKEMAEACGWKLLAGEEGQDNEVDGCYVGDLLSWVMGRAQAGNVWLTVMGNLNAIAVAALADTSCMCCARILPWTRTPRSGRTCRASRSTAVPQTCTTRLCRSMRC